MTTKKLTARVFVLTFSVLALATTATKAEAKFTNEGTAFKSSILSPKDTPSGAPKVYANSGKTINDYKSCNKNLLTTSSEDIADDYDSAMQNDPLQGYNRVMHSFNHALDRAILRPVAKGYRAVVPQWGRDRISNVFNNLDEPRNFVNSALQFDSKSMFTSFWRFAINTTFGIGGMHDVASGFGLRGVDKDFSTTLAYYGAETGPYFVIPLLGPSTIRDAFGKIPDAVTYPPNYIDEDEVSAAITINVADAIQSREAILDYTDDLEVDSFDLYSSYKSSYLQNRKKQVQRSLKQD